MKCLKYLFIVCIIAGAVVIGLDRPYPAARIAWAAADKTAGTFAEQWPYEIKLPEGTVIIYQPQVESFKGTHLVARAAISGQKADMKEPVFGVVWFGCTVVTNRDTRMAEFTDIKVEKIQIPNATNEKEAKASQFLEKQMASMKQLNMSLDRLLALVAVAEREKISDDAIQSNPPKIIYSSEPAELVNIDGKPILRDVKNTSVQRVVNTPCILLYDPSSKAYYLKGPDIWFTAPDISAVWQKTDTPPAAIVEALKALSAEGADAQKPTQKPKAATLPRIIVATEPTELIVTEGKPEYTPVSGTNLVYISNTDSDVFRDITSQKYYVLLAGRWFSSASLQDGPWTYMASDKLPAGFMKVPPGSDKGHILAFVSGTTAAEEAVVDAQIPQTAAIKRDSTITVSYDGTPKFEQIEGTKMSYAVNTSYSVVRSGNMYYCCNQAAWYEAGDPNGPWKVSTSVPQEIYTIPPSCPIYNVKYVNVYNSTPDVVNVGYTSGYTGSYVANDGTVVYGTGYTYPAYVSNTVYYPPPATYGYAPTYNQSNGGWMFATGLLLGAAIGVAASDDHYHSSGWWGPWGYGGGYGDVDIDIDRSFNNVNLNRSGNINRYGNRQGDLGRNNNIYNRKDNQLRNVQKQPADRRDQLAKDTRRDQRKPETRDVKPAQKPGTGKRNDNNVFAGRDGDVYRKTDKGWEQRDQNKWSNPAKNENTRKNFENKQPTLDRDNKARQRGAEKTKNFERSQSSKRDGGDRGSRGGDGGRKKSGGGKKGGDRKSGGRGGGRGR